MTEETKEQRPQRFIRKQDLPLYVGLKLTQINEMIKRGIFNPVQASDTGTAVVLPESEILAWQAARIAKREQDKAARTVKVVPRLKKGRDAYLAVKRAKRAKEAAQIPRTDARLKRNKKRERPSSGA